MTKERFREIIVNSESSFRFLGAEDGYWLGADREYSISEMPKEYKDNCIKYLHKYEETIKAGSFLQGVKYNKEDYKELVRLGCEAMKQKISGLSN